MTSSDMKTAEYAGLTSASTVYLEAAGVPDFLIQELYAGTLDVIAEPVVDKQQMLEKVVNSELGEFEKIAAVFQENGVRAFETEQYDLSSVESQNLINNISQDQGMLRS